MITTCGSHGAGARGRGRGRGLRSTILRQRNLLAAPHTHGERDGRRAAERDSTLLAKHNLPN